MDRVSAEVRSRNMSRVRSRDTKPEKRIRSLLHALGFRFRLCDKTLPGTPDIVLKKHKAVIFVNGCFWHRHRNCSRATTPENNREYWLKKFEANVARDKKNCSMLAKAGWRIVVIWECRIGRILKNPSRLAKALTEPSTRKKIEL